MPKKRKLPAKTVEERENLLIKLSMDLAEKMLLEGTAPSQIIYHFLKMGSSREKAEMERLRNENELLKEKVETTRSERRSEEVYQKAIEAFSSYKSSADQENYE